MRKARGRKPIPKPDSGTKKEDKPRVIGVVKEKLPNAAFLVELENGHEVLATVSGKMRKHFIRIMSGDRVEMEVSPYDTTRGRIVWLHR